MDDGGLYNFLLNVVWFALTFIIIFIIQSIICKLLVWVVYHLRYKNIRTSDYIPYDNDQELKHIDVFEIVNQNKKTDIKDEHVNVYNLGCNNNKSKCLELEIDKHNHIVQNIVDNNYPFMDRKLIDFGYHDHCTMTQFLLLIHYGTSIGIWTLGILFYISNTFETEKIYNIFVVFGVLSSIISYLSRDIIGNTYCGFKIWYYGKIRIGDIISTRSLPRSKLISMDFSMLHFMNMNYNGNQFTDIRTVKVNIDSENYNKHHTYYGKIISMPYRNLNDTIEHHVAFNLV